MKISQHKVVSVSYTLREDNALGRVIEQTSTEKPFTFLFGVGQLLPDFEQHLNGLGADDTFAFGIESAKAYGLSDPERIVDLPIDIFMVNGKVDTKMLQIGNIIPLRDQAGHVHQGKVLGTTLSMVKMDFNHPMAGINLFFVGKVLSVREATASELDHGHAHGPGGHHHH